MTILLLAVFAFFIFTMFRRNKKTQQQQAATQSKFAPGVDVMTSFGLYGRIVSVDDAENKIVLELSPGTLATVHRQSVTKVIEPAAPAADSDVEAPASAGADFAEAGTAPSSGITLGKADSDAPRSQDHFSETPEETLRRLNDEGKSAN
ncbi:preprotein translocase subunit YajC [Sinomonas sp. ASV486]|uniref:Preprotein translocase subunit YajC n=1 Tax=Sinomonas puerhi TaxID=3238584 RepID=A0AB39L8X3_9MICC|nr:preprotein translocase subunit YajC [Sinomonas sp. ASV486]MDQ4491494.1 preprotein translocase subunit YajC [Sinomonas sp. ASV486]